MIRRAKPFSLIMVVWLGCAGSQGSDSTLDGANSSSLDKGLVAHWCFDHPDQVGADCSRGGYDGHPEGAVSLVPGVIGQAAYFDGASWIEIPSPFFLDGLCEASLTAFLRLDDLDRTAQVLGGGDFRGGTDPLSFQITDGRFTNVGFEDITDDSFIKTPWDDRTQHLIAGQWHHLAVTLTNSVPGDREDPTSAEGADLRVFVDGQLTVEVHRDAPRCIGYDIAMPTQIGAIHTTQTWQGAIDELRIYHRSLSPEEVALLAAHLPR